MLFYSAYLMANHRDVTVQNVTDQCDPPIQYEYKPTSSTTHSTINIYFSFHKTYKPKIKKNHWKPSHHKDVEKNRTHQSRFDRFVTKEKKRQRNLRIKGSLRGQQSCQSEI